MSDAGRKMFVYVFVTTRSEVLTICCKTSARHAEMKARIAVQASYYYSTRARTFALSGTIRPCAQIRDNNTGARASAYLSAYARTALHLSSGSILAWPFARFSSFIES